MSERNATAIFMKKMHIHTLYFFNVYLLPLLGIKIQVDKLQTDSLGKSNEITMDSKFAKVKDNYAKK